MEKKNEKRQTSEARGSGDVGVIKAIKKQEKSSKCFVYFIRRIRFKRLFCPSLIYNPFVFHHYDDMTLNYNID